MGHAESGGRAAEFSSLTAGRETDAVGVASPVCKIGIRFFPQVEHTSVSRRQRARVLVLGL